MKSYTAAEIEGSERIQRRLYGETLAERRARPPAPRPASPPQYHCGRCRDAGCPWCPDETPAPGAATCHEMW